MSAFSRIAFFGGSFDPPHLGHLAVARAAREALRLDRILFVPVGAQPLKPGGASASYEDRVAMTSLAIEGEPAFEVSLLDAPKDGPNYTLDTLHALRTEQPQARLFLILGADAFALLRNWHGAAEIPFTASLVVVSRPGQPIDNLAEMLPKGLSLAPAVAETAESDASSDTELRTYTLRDGNGHTAPFYLLPDLYVSISASQIRAQTRAGAPSPLTSGVAEYIREHGLYQ